MVLRDKSVVRFGYNVSEILPQKVATGTAYACLRPIERASSSGARACSQKVLGLRMFPYAFLLQKKNLPEGESGTEIKRGVEVIHAP